MLIETYLKKVPGTNQYCTVRVTYSLYNETTEDLTRLMIKTHITLELHLIRHILNRFSLDTY